MSISLVAGPKTERSAKHVDSADVEPESSQRWFHERGHDGRPTPFKKEKNPKNYVPFCRARVDFRMSFNVAFPWGTMRNARIHDRLCACLRIKGSTRLWVQKMTSISWYDQIWSLDSMTIWSRKEHHCVRTVFESAEAKENVQKSCGNMPCAGETQKLH